MKHTPGPWTPVHSSAGLRISTAGKSREKYIAEIMTPAFNGSATHTGLYPEMVPNAHLIASAPEMYQALILAEKRISRMELENPELFIQNGVTLRAVRSAIAKAEGKD